MSRILVTGGAGFLGSHLVDALVVRTDEIVILDNLRRGRLPNIEQHINSARITFLERDIRLYADVESALDGVHTVYHLAAQSNVMGSLTDPNYSFETNVLGTYNVLRAASEAGTRKIVFSSSREAYGEPEALPVQEADSSHPKNMYGASKVAGEAYCRAFHETTNLDCTILRFGNIYGSRDYGRVIPLWLDRARAGRDLELYGGDQILDFVPVDLAVSALLQAAEYDGLGPINVASGIGTTLIALAERILEETASESVLRREPARRIEVTRFVADVSRMREELKLEPPSDPLRGLRSMVKEATPAAT